MLKPNQFRSSFNCKPLAPKSFTPAEIYASAWKGCPHFSECGGLLNFVAWVWEVIFTKCFYSQLSLSLLHVFQPLVSLLLADLHAAPIGLLEQRIIFPVPVFRKVSKILFHYFFINERGHVAPSWISRPWMSSFSTKSSTWIPQGLS